MWLYAATQRTAVRRLDPRDHIDALALKLVARTAYFAPGEPIPIELLFATVDVPANEGDAVADADEALGRLIDLGLLESEADQAVRLHRLLAVYVRAVTTDVEAQGAVEDAMIRVSYELN